MRMLLRVLMCVMVMLTSVAMPRDAVAQCEGRWLTSPEQVPHGVNDQVRALLVTQNDELIVGGYFLFAGSQKVECIAKWSGGTWTPFGTGLSGGVRALAMMPNGDLVAGGYFDYASGVLVNKIARWDGMSWIPFGSGVAGSVIAIAVLPNGDVVAGGTFPTAGGVTVNGIARWNGSEWRPMGTGMSAGPSQSGIVYALVVLPNGDLIAGGQFTSSDGVVVNHIARWDGVRWNSLGTGMSGESSVIVTDLAVLPNGNLIAGGSFNSVDGVPAQNLAVWNGSSWSPMASGGVIGPVRSIAALHDGDVIVSSSISSAASYAAIRRWNGSTWNNVGTTLTRPYNCHVESLAVMSNGDVIAGGSFNLSGSLHLLNIARWNGTSWTPFGEGLDGIVNALEVTPNGDVIAGGSVYIAGSKMVGNVARLSGSTWSGLGTGVNGSVNAVAVMPNGHVFLGGKFNNAGGTGAPYVARWNGVSWMNLAGGSLEGYGSLPAVHALTLRSNGDLLIGGYNFSLLINQQGSRNLASWNNSVWTPMAPGALSQDPGPRVNVLISLPNGDTVAGGFFETVGGVNTTNLARWDGSVWSRVEADFPTFSEVYSLAVLPNGDLIVGGNFGSLGTVTVNGIARWNGSNWAPFGSGVSGGAGPPTVRALAVMPNGDIVAGGNFSNAGGVTVNRVARWNGISWSAMGSGVSRTASGQLPTVYALKLHPSGELLAGGDFLTAGGVASGSWARWTETGIPWIARQPLPQTVNAEETLTLTATCASGYDFDGPVTYQWQRNGVNIVNGAAGASPNGGTVTGASGALPTPTTNPTATLTITGAKPGDTGAYTIIFANGCGSVTSTPAMITVTGNCTADFNSDTVVDLFDYLDFVAAFAANAPEADFNADTVIDFLDYLDFAEAFATGC